MKLTKKKLQVFGKEFEKEPLFKKVCLNLSECEENKIFMNFMLFMVWIPLRLSGFVWEKLTGY